MTQTYYAIKHKTTGEILGGPHGTSSAPHLYHTAGKANAALRVRKWRAHVDYEVVPVQLTELTKE